MKKTPFQPDIKIWRPPEISGVELISATGVTQSLPKHVHSDFAMVVVQKGAYKILNGAKNHTMTAGGFYLAQPGETISCGASEEAGRTFRGLDVSPALFQNTAAEISRKDLEMPVFFRQIPPDKRLSMLFLEVHKSLEKPASQLENSSLLQELLAYIFTNYAESGNSSFSAFGKEHRAVKLVREFLEDNFRENISLEQIAEIADLSSFYLNRVFRQTVGIPPHAYQIQVRVERAKTLLAQDVPIEQAALAVGFFDQSHFTNHFKRLNGFTPGFYQQNILHL